jgi:peptidyl-prolyl cis-trans isomerase C
MRCATIKEKLTVVVVWMFDTYQQGENIMQIKISRQLEPALAFNLVKFSLQIFEKELNELTIEEYLEVYLQASNGLLLYRKILQSEAACGVVIPEAFIRTAYERFQAEHGGEEFFPRHLQKNKLKPADYLTCLGNELKVEAVLARVAFHAETVGQEEIEAYYESHQTAFALREQRSARHILFSSERWSSSQPGDALLHRISFLHSRLQRNPQAFSEEALRHSDCVTASCGGYLGRISPGELCIALDQALFQMKAGEISPVIQTAQGFHILYCEAVHATGIAEVHCRIRQILTQKKRTQACRAWLMALFREPIKNLP